jgi:hypothetical protein
MSNVMIDAGAAVIDNEPLDPDDLAAFLDGNLEGSDRARVEALLADNPAARQELIKASRIMSSAPKKKAKRQFRFTPLIGLAAAAAIAVVLIRPGETARESTPVSAERRGMGDEPERVEIVSPADAQRLTGDKSPFAWHPVNGARYRVVILDNDGNTVYENTQTDTLLTLPSSVRSAGTYYWSVDAQYADGTSITSGAHEFVLTGK